MQVFEYGERGTEVVLIQPVDDHDLSVIENEAAEIKRLTDRRFHLIAVKVDDWNCDLSPWPAPAVFGSEGFGGKADGFLEKVLELISGRTKSLPPPRGRRRAVTDEGAAFYEIPQGISTFIIGGYSLAGLFALWAAYRTDAFKAVAAASPSIWFPGFTDYMREHEIRCGAVYLSLGDREERARNPVMATVGDRIREAHSLLSDRKINCTLEWNPGNHFKDADIRTAKAFAWAMGQINQ